MTADGAWMLGGKTVRLSRGVLAGSRRAASRDAPLVRTESTNSPEEGPAEIPIPLAKSLDTQECTILHVDDDHQVGELVELYLTQINDDFEVVSKTSPVAAIDFLESATVDCIVSDYEMPTTNGLEFLEIVRERYQDIPFILFTGKGSEEIASEAIAAGVTDYMQKGGKADTYEVLANRVENAIEQHRAQQQFWNALSWYQRLVEQELAGVCIIQDGAFVYVNQKLADIFGYDQDSLIDASPSILTAEDDASMLAAIQAAETEDAETFHSEFEGLQANGERKEFEVSGGAIEYDGDPAWIGVVRDRQARTETDG